MDLSETYCFLAFAVVASVSRIDKHFSPLERTNYHLQKHLKELSGSKKV